jgi:hypothetical protein
MQEMFCYETQGKIPPGWPPAQSRGKPGMSPIKFLHPGHRLGRRDGLALLAHIKSLAIRGDTRWLAGTQADLLAANREGFLAWRMITNPWGRAIRSRSPIAPNI